MNSNINSQDVIVVAFLENRTPESFAAIVSKYTPSVRGFIYNIVFHIEDTDDLTQETFLSAYKSFDSFRQESKFSTWLLKIAMNHALRFLERSKKIVYLDDKFLDGPVETVNVPNEMIAIETRKKIQKMIFSLPENLRIVLVLSVIEGYSTAEISEICSCTRTMVYWRLHQARKRMELFIKDKKDA